MDQDDDIFSRSIDRLLRKKDDAIQKSEEDFLRNFSEIEKKIFDAVKKKTFEMNSKDGAVVFDETNTDIVNSLNKTIRDAIQGSAYPDKVSSYLRDFDQVKKYNFEAQISVNGLKESELEKLVNPIQKAVVNQTLDGLAGIGIDTNFSDPLRIGLYKNVVAGSSFAELENYLRGYILTDEIKLGKFKNYVTQISRDALNQFDGQVNRRIAQEYDLNAYRYVGSLIADSRPQCKRWTAKGVLLLEELETEIAWATSNGTGLIPGTTPENFAVYRGGYNCRHSAIPFKLTKSQREELGLDNPEKIQEEEAKLAKKGVAPLTEAEKDLNLTYGKSKLIPPGLEAIVRDLKIPDQVFELSDDGSWKVATGTEEKINKKTPSKNDFFYDPFDKKVTLGTDGRRWSQSKEFQKKVVVHEYGHRTHFEKKIFRYGEDQDPEHKAEFEKSNKLLKDRIKKLNLGPSDFDPNTIAYKYRGKFEGLTDRDLVELAGAYTDTIEALSKGKYGFGHGKEYFTQNKGSFRFMEWHVHAHENYFLGNPVFKAEFPELYDQMNDYLRELVVKRYLKNDLK